MSLTTFLKNKDVKDMFKQEFKKPSFECQADLLAPPITERYSLVGTAFDYILRFYLKNLNPDAKEQTWISVTAFRVLAMVQAYDLAGRPTNTPDMQKLNEALAKYPALSNPHALRKVVEILQYSKKAYDEYLRSGVMSHELFKSALLLAQVDVIFRAAIVDENLGRIDEKDIDDLRNLTSIIKPENFKTKNVCVLNPTFGEASTLVGGADCDLVVDDALIDIKTTKNLELNRSYFDQLLGYYTLYKIGGINNAPPKHEIKKLGIYFSRHAYLHIINVHEVIRENTYPTFVEWFKKRCSEEPGMQG